MFWVINFISDLKLKWWFKYWKTIWISAATVSMILTSACWKIGDLDLKWWEAQSWTETWYSQDMRNDMQRLLSEILKAESVINKDIVIKKWDKKVLDNFPDIINKNYVYTQISECMQYYKLIDSVARQMNFSTNLALATFNRENKCKKENPSNGMWVFQDFDWKNKKIRKLYKPGLITDKMLKQQTKIFIQFNKDKYEEFKGLVGPINIGYKKTTVHDLILSSVLYSWYTSRNNPSNSHYALWNINEKFSWLNDWVVTFALRLQDPSRFISHQIANKK